MVNRLFYALVIVVLLAAFAVPAFAQEVTPEPVPTAEPPPVIVTPETGINLATVVYGIIIAVLGGGTVAAILTRMGSRKETLDAMEKLYLSFPPATQETITRVTDVLVKMADILQKVTDKLPNEDVPAEIVRNTGPLPPNIRRTPPDA